MAKRRVYIPGRDEGWSNGRYWKKKSAEDVHPDDNYRAYCTDCDADTIHEWDMCTACDQDDRGNPRSIKESTKDPDLEAFGRDIAEH